MFIQKIIEKYFSLDIENKIGRNIFFWRVILITTLSLIMIPFLSFIGLIFKFGDIFAFIFGDFFSGLLFLSFFVSTLGKLIYYSSLIFLFRKRTNDIGLQGNFSRNLIFIHFLFSILSSFLFTGYMEGVPGFVYLNLNLESIFLAYIVLYESIFNGLAISGSILPMLMLYSLNLLLILIPYIIGGIIFIQYIKMSLIKGN